MKKTTECLNTLLHHCWWVKLFLLWFDKYSCYCRRSSGGLPTRRLLAQRQVGYISWA